MPDLVFHGVESPFIGTGEHESPEGDGAKVKQLAVVMASSPAIGGETHEVHADLPLESCVSHLPGVECI